MQRIQIDIGEISYLTNKGPEAEVGSQALSSELAKWGDSADASRQMQT